MSRPVLHLPRLLPVAIVAAAAAFALTGCEPGALAPQDSALPSASPSASAAPSETPGSTDEPIDTEPADSETPAPTTPPVAGDLACSDIFTAAQLYDFNPNFAPTTQQGELPGATAEIADAGGTVCVYQHVTGSDRLVVAVLQDPATLDYPAFELVGDDGVATSRASNVLISVASIYFASERDAQSVIDQVSSNLL